MGELGKSRRAGTPAKGIPWPARIPYVKGRSPYTESKGLARNSSAMHRRCLSWREVDLTAVKGGTETHPSSRSFGLDYPSLGPRDISARAGLGRGY
jgi:hypothetical protein